MSFSDKKPFLKAMMGPTRFERVTSRLSAVRSTWLSYGPDPHFALMIPFITVSLLLLLHADSIIPGWAGFGMTKILLFEVNPACKNPLAWTFRQASD
jgi:hypothetical protein